MNFTARAKELIRQGKATDIDFSKLPDHIKKTIKEALLLRKVEVTTDYQGEYGVDVKDWLVADSDQMAALTKNNKFQGFESNGEGKFSLFFNA